MKAQSGAAISRASSIVDNPTKFRVFRGNMEYHRVKFEACSYSRSRDIAGVCKFRSRSFKLGHINLDLVFCMLSKVLLVVDGHTKYSGASRGCYGPSLVPVLPQAPGGAQHPPAPPTLWPCPKGGSKTPNGRFPSKIALYAWRKSATKFLCVNLWQSFRAFIGLNIRAKMIVGGRPLKRKFCIK